jgi:hypothetical protein
MNAIEAIADLKDEIEAGMETSKAVEYTARQHGTKPEVLRIRFERAHGSSPEAYRPRTAVSMQDLVQQTVAEEARKWRLSDHGQAALGTKFYADRQWWHFVAYADSRLHAVRADSAKVWVFQGGWLKDVLRQVDEKIAG